MKMTPYSRARTSRKTEVLRSERGVTKGEAEMIFLWL